MRPRMITISHKNISLTDGWDDMLLHACNKAVLRKINGVLAYVNEA